jgi:hypothetical protein
MNVRAIWRHREDYVYYLVERSADGELLGASGPLLPKPGPISADKARALLLGNLVPNVKAFKHIKSKQDKFVEDYELDDEGQVWDFHGPTSAGAPLETMHQFGAHIGP